MNLKIRYEANIQVIVLDEISRDKTATSLSITRYETETDEDLERRIQVEFDNKFNKSEYNIYHRETRHIIPISTLTGGDVDATNSDEMLYKAVADKDKFSMCTDENQRKYEAICGNIRSNVKAETADMVIAVMLDGVSIQDYANKIGEKANTVSKRYNRALKKLNKLGKSVLLAGV